MSTDEHGVKDVHVKDLRPSASSEIMDMRIFGMEYGLSQSQYGGCHHRRTAALMEHRQQREGVVVAEWGRTRWGGDYHDERGLMGIMGGMLLWVQRALSWQVSTRI